MIKRKGMTLIELIFSIVIIALVFTVIPKIIYAFNKSDSFSIREDAFFNGMSTINLISRLPWDENNTLYNDILETNSSNSYFDCNSSTNFYRRGGFVGSRNCIHEINASDISNDGESDWVYYNDVDDFNDTNISAFLNTGRVYTLANSVWYAKDNIFDYDGANQFVNIRVQDANKTNISTNLKMIKTDVYYAGRRGRKRHLTQFSYISANIGQIVINKRVWGGK